MKFKVGDKVKILAEEFQSMNSIGKKGEINKIYSQDMRYDYSACVEGKNWNYREHELEGVEEKKEIKLEDFLEAFKKHPKVCGDYQRAIDETLAEVKGEKKKKPELVEGDLYKGIYSGNYCIVTLIGSKKYTIYLTGGAYEVTEAQLVENFTRIGKASEVLTVKED